jgi:glycosyltransferase involved in cell wall biosynthesis
LNKKKIAFFVRQGLDSFLDDIVDGLKYKYETQKIIVTNYIQIDEGMEWADICWFEWCDELLIYGSNHLLASSKRILCRLHGYEVYENLINEPNWENVDTLIIVAPHIKRLFEDRMKNIDLSKLKIVLIHCGINTEKYEINEKSNGYNIGYLGYINYKKNIPLTLEIFKNLYYENSNYCLYLAGEFQDYRTLSYFKYFVKEYKLEKNIIYEGWKNLKEKKEWFKKINYMLISSIDEGLCYAAAEAMCCGIKPILHNCEGLKDHYDKKYIFNSVDEAIQMIKSEDYNSKEYRAFISKNYSLKYELKLIEELLAPSPIIYKVIDNTEKNILPLVTIGITNYNSEKYLNECINSILPQSYKNIEIIVVDDNSNDASIKILEEFKRTYKNIKIIYHDKNSGSPDLARKEIIEQASGDYLMFLDSDDYLNNDYSIQKLVSFLIENKTYDYAYSNMEIVNEKSIKIDHWQFEQYKNEKIICDTFKRFGSGILTMKGLFKTDFFKKNSISYLSNGTAGDTLLSLLCIAKGLNIHFIDEALISYRQHSNNFTFDINKRISALVQVEEYIVENFPEDIYFPETDWVNYDSNLREATKNFMLGNHYFNMLIIYYEDKWRPWINSIDNNGLLDLVSLCDLKELIIKYLSNCCKLSKAYDDKIFNIMLQLEKVFGVRISLNNY